MYLYSYFHSFFSSSFVCFAACYKINVKIYKKDCVYRVTFFCENAGEAIKIISIN